MTVCTTEAIEEERLAGRITIREEALTCAAEILAARNDPKMD